MIVDPKQLFFQSGMAHPHGVNYMRTASEGWGTESPQAGVRALRSLIFIEETLPDRGAARLSCRGAHADSRSSSRCCRALASPGPWASWRRARSRANRERGEASAATPLHLFQPLLGRRGLPLHDFHYRILAEPEIAGNAPVGQPLSM